MVDPYTNGSLFAAILGILISMAAGLMWKNKWALFVSGIVSYVIFRVMLTYVGGWPVDSTLAILYGLGVLVVDIVGYVAYKKLTAPRVPGGPGFWTKRKILTVIGAIAIIILGGLVWAGYWKVAAVIVLLAFAVGGILFLDGKKRWIVPILAFVLMAAIIFGQFGTPPVQNEKKNENAPVSQQTPAPTATPPAPAVTATPTGAAVQPAVTPTPSFEYNLAGNGSVSALGPDGRPLYSVNVPSSGESKLYAEGAIKDSGKITGTFIMYGCTGKCNYTEFADEKTKEFLRGLLNK